MDQKYGFCPKIWKLQETWYIRLMINFEAIQGPSSLSIIQYVPLMLGY